MDSSPPPAPAAPDYGQANSEGVFAQAALLPTQLAIQQAANLGTSGNLSVPTISGNSISGYQNLPYDFSSTGGNNAIQTQQQEQLLNLAQTAAPALLNLQQQYGLPYVQQQRAEQQASDPEAFALRQQLGQQLQDQLGQGTNLTSGENYNVEQATRQGQQARGALFDPGAGIEEAYNKFDVGQRLQQQRMQNAQAFVFGQPLASYNVSTAQQGAAPYTPIGGTAQGANVNPNAGQQAAQFAQGIYGTQGSMYNSQLAYQGGQGNHLLSGLGTIGGIGASLLGNTALFSSEKVKENIEEFNDGYDMVKSLNVKRYDYKKGWGKKDCIGLIAEETPEPIRIKGPIDMVDLYSLVSVLVDAIKTMQVKIERMEAYAQ